MEDWHLAQSLEVGQQEVDARWPNRDRSSDGTIGDEAHQTRVSDHNPNSRGSVNAWDIDVDGVDILAILRAFERHPSAHYWIYGGRIADADNDWRPTQYGGSNPHRSHAHLSIRQTSTAENDTRTWGIHPTREEELLPDERKALFDIRHAVATVTKPDGTGETHVSGGIEILLNGQNTLLKAIVDTQDRLATLISGIGKLDPEAFAAALAASPNALDALTSAMRDQLPLVPTAREVARVFLDIISGNYHEGDPA